MNLDVFKCRDFITKAMGCSMAYLELRKKDPPVIQVIIKLENYMLSRSYYMIQEYKLLQLSSSKFIFQIL